MEGNVYFAEIVWKWNFSAGRGVLLIYLLFWKHIFREAGVRQIKYHYLATLPLVRRYHSLLCTNDSSHFPLLGI